MIDGVAQLMRFETQFRFQTIRRYKRDLFAKKIMKKALTEVSEWHDYNGKTCDYDEGVNFFLQKFLEKNQQKNKDIYTHVTCATDTENVKVVFNASKDIILKFNLEASGFM